MRLTRATAKTELADFLPSGKENARLNLAIERLLIRGRWKGATDRLEIAVYDGLVTLPQSHETVERINLNASPRIVRSPWYEFAPGGFGTVASTSRFPEPIDRGDGHCTFRDPDTLFPDGCKLRVKLENDDDTGIEVIIGVDLATEVADGVNGRDEITDTVTYATQGTDTIGTGVTGVTRFYKPQTVGRVFLFAVDPDDETDETLIGIYEKAETEICLRRYEVPSTNDADVATVFARRRFKRLAADTELIPIDSIYALRQALTALQYEDEGAPDVAANYWSAAVGALDDQLKGHRGSQQGPVPVYLHGSNNRIRPLR